MRCVEDDVERFGTGEKLSHLDRILQQRHDLGWLQAGVERYAARPGRDRQAGQPRRRTIGKHDRDPIAANDAQREEWVRLFAIDKIGQGGTDNPKRDEDYTMAATVHHACAALDALGEWDAKQPFSPAALIVLIDRCKTSNSPDSLAS